MNRIVPCLATAVLAALLTPACRTTPAIWSQPGCRVLKLALAEDGIHWRLRVNDGRIVQGISSVSLSNCLSRLALQHGDILLLQKLEQTPPVGVYTLGDWLTRQCELSEVAFYVEPKPDIPGGIFSVPVYHWETPYSKRPNLAEASFYLEGTPLGKGMRGYETLLADIKLAHPHYLFILGSLCNWDNSLAPGEAPYEAHRGLLDNILADVGAKQLIPSQVR
jgi:hypothetical protein